MPPHAGQRSISIEWTMLTAMSFVQPGHFMATILPRTGLPPRLPGGGIGAEITAARSGAQALERVRADPLLGVAERLDQRRHGDLQILVADQDRGVEPLERVAVREPIGE